MPLKFGIPAFVLLLVLLTGCAGIGPKTVPRDRFDYNRAISDSWKEQTLLNIVKLRYADMPLFVEVSSVVSGYTLEGRIDASGAIGSQTSATGDFINLEAGAKYVDRPTITYSPISGKQFTKSFMRPIPPWAVFFLMQTGWPADMIVPIAVESVNGLRADVVIPPGREREDFPYYRMVESLRVLQTVHALSMQIEGREEIDSETYLFFHNNKEQPEIAESLEKLRQLLKLKSGKNRYSVGYGLYPDADTDIAMLTRSMLQIMVELSLHVRVPAVDEAEGRTLPWGPVDTLDDDAELARIIQIHHSKNVPENAFAKVFYRDNWYWIDDRDFKSKHTFAFVMILFSLSETGARESLPTITIPTN